MLDALAGIRFDHEQHAAAASGSADLGTEGAVLARDGNEAVDERRGDGGRIGAAKLPLLAQKASGLRPVGGSDGGAHGAGNFADSLEVAEDLAVAIDVALEDLPVVDAALTRGSGIGEDKAAVKFIGIAWNGVAMDAIDIQTVPR